ncbi:hypothetical protein PZA22_08750 [Pectobacterium polaris]|uniref:hypothetical protein n=1 Tax=Pectobacterium polaris TaxID=2042057 RepID=UPI0023AE8B43|nr:hypothetical protein [Pectobacterium polaris]MDE8754589.1 hypothetical protein [Pectobacterium polaris]
MYTITVCLVWLSAFTVTLSAVADWVAARWVSAACVLVRTNHSRSSNWMTRNLTHKFPNTKG